MTNTNTGRTIKSENYGKELRQLVHRYLKENKSSRFGNNSMITKSIIMLSAYIIPIIILNLGIVSHAYLIFLLYFICGIGMAGIGMGVMHDALHGSYSKNKLLNRIMGHSINLIGANESVWKIQHNVLHHTYTNIDAMDDDLDTYGVLRFSPDTKWRWHHQYQHYYAWFFYGLMTMVWMSTRDFVRIKKYRKMGFFKDPKAYNMENLKSILIKMVFLSFLLIIPMLINPVKWWVVILAFLSMHFITGIIISLVFQTAHIMPDVDFPQHNKEDNHQDSRLYHQLSTTSNYGKRSRFFSWFIGGLNYQIEHHLFPDICHVHYKEISDIVKKFTIEKGLPYHSKPSFIIAVADHFRMLRTLGVNQQ